VLRAVDAHLARRGESEARTLLAHFGLGADAIRRPLERLSPGQRARAAIAAIVASGADLLLLDEPTNHLDFDTLEVLERALAASPSTIVAVSHDRWFLEAIGAPRRLHVEGGRVSEAPYDAMLGRHVHLSGHGWGGFSRLSPL
jgi:ATPase subunit of ABC transporter with duplicated ATPase domains